MFEEQRIPLPGGFSMYRRGTEPSDDNAYGKLLLEKLNIMNCTKKSKILISIRSFVSLKVECKDFAAL